jgi:hypothetical protein
MIHSHALQIIRIEIKADIFVEMEAKYKRERVKYKYSENTTFLLWVYEVDLFYWFFCMINVEHLVMK